MALCVIVRAQATLSFYFGGNFKVTVSSIVDAAKLFHVVIEGSCFNLFAHCTLNNCFLPIAAMSVPEYIEEVVTEVKKRPDVF
jgi:hypothetical protein